MRTATKTTAKMEQIEEGDWLSQLLVDVQEEIARQPGANAVQRIRARLLAKLDRPERAAA